MWTTPVLDTDVYHLFAAFVAYSMLGWLVESIYMSFCEKKITNRGFAKGPFCPIYGFGALGAYLIFTPLKGKHLLIYVLGCITATIFEYLVGRLMIRLLGSLWWDYHEKPFNFQGIICLESTLAWGFYALFIVYVLHGTIVKLVDLVSMKTGLIIVFTILSIAVVDYAIQLYKLFGKPKKAHTSMPDEENYQDKGK